MPTNFGPEITSAPELETHTTVKEGVSSPARSYGEIGAVFDAAAQIFVDTKKDKDSGVVNQFIQEQIKIADSLEQGGITLSAARTRQRANFAQYVNNYGHLTDDLLKAQATITGTAGLSRVVSQGTERTDRIATVNQAAVDQGLVAPDASEEEFAKVRENVQIAAAAEAKHKERMRTLDAKAKGLAVESAEYQKIERERKESTKEYVSDSMPARFNQVTTAFENIIKSNKTGPEKQKEIELLAQSMFTEYSKELSALDSGDRGVFVKPFEEVRDLYLKLASGEIEATELKNRIDITTSKSEALLLMDPQIRNMVAVSSLLGPEAATTLLLQGAKQEVINRIGNFIAGGDPNSGITSPSLYSENAEDKKATDIYTKSITEGVLSDNETFRSEAETHLNTTLEGLIDDEGRIRRNPKAAFQPVKWIASQEFYKARTTRPELFEDYTEDLNSVLSTHYFDEVAVMINKEFEEKKVLVKNKRFQVFADEVPANTLAVAEATPTGMKFVPVDDSLRARETATNLNKELKPIINETIKAMAHLDGRNDYGAYFEEVSEQFGGMLPSGLQEQQTEIENDEGDDLTMEDYRTGKVEMPTITSSKGWTQGRTQGVNEDLVGLVERVKQDTGINFVVTEGLRSEERQRKLVDQGASQTMNSRHLHGNAIDIVILDDNGQPIWDFEAYRPLGDAAKRIAQELGYTNFVWGGDWKSLRDGVHFQLG